MCRPTPFEHVIDSSCVSNVFVVRQGYRHPSKVEFPAKHNFYFGKSSLCYQLFSCIHFVPREGLNFGESEKLCLTSSRGGCLNMRFQPQDCSPSPNDCDIITPSDSAHQPLPGEMLADRYPLGDVYGTVTVNLPVPWSPSGVPPGASLRDT